MSDSARKVSELIHRNTTKNLIHLSHVNRNLKLNSESWSASLSNVTMAIAFVYVDLTMTLTFDDGTVLRFEGQAPGVGLGGTGGGTGSATFNVSPQQLLSMDKVSFVAATASGVVGAISVDWGEYAHIGMGAYLGSGICYGLGVGVGLSFGGSGSFTQ